jgi:hypothetical protein
VFLTPETNVLQLVLCREGMARGGDGGRGGGGGYNVRAGRYNSFLPERNEGGAREKAPSRVRVANTGAVVAEFKISRTVWGGEGGGYGIRDSALGIALRISAHEGAR